MNLKGWVFIGMLLWAGNGLMAQQIDTAYFQQWREIDSLFGVSHLPKSALVKVIQIYQQAEKQSNKIQQIKALLYRTAIENIVVETDINKNVSAFKLELSKTNDPGCKALLHVLIAKQYQKYFNDHRWQLYDRSKIKAQNNNDILSWSADDFLKNIESAYNAALSDKETLKKTNLNAFGAILWKGNAENLRPTLYDVIAQDALDYFKTGQESRTKAKNSFTIQQQASLGTYVEFASLKLVSNDSNAHLFRALQLFQDLTLFHINDVQKDALIDLDIDRINWVYQQVNFENKKQLKEKALTAIITDFESNTAAYAWLQLANDKSELAATYQPFQDSSERWQYQASIKLIDAAIKKFADKNPVKNQLENLKQRILQKDISIQSEKIDIPNKPIKVLVEYKNVDTLYIRILALPLEFTKSNNLGEQLISLLCNKSPIQSSEQWLPVTNDYQNHFVEIKLDPLSHGEYVLLCSTGKNFNSATDIINYQSFQVSNISLIQNKNDFFVLNRETGKPISKSTITILSRPSNTQSKEWDKEAVKITDENGYVNIGGQNSNRYYSFIIESKNEKFRVIDPTWIENEQNTNDLTDSIHFEKRNQRTFFFTDRSIYRPGQNIYFKAIVSTLDFNNQKSKLLAKSNATVYLRDVNYRIIDSLKFTSNDYGSYHGKFTLPEKVLTGNFSLTVKNGETGSTNFSVESYKRPTYSIQFEKITKSYQLNDTIEVKGIAKAFAGNLINGANLTYHVVRNDRFLNPYSRYRMYAQSQPQEIAQGTIQTDEKGAFTIQFKAVPDITKEASSKPIFDYTIDATITDASGETRTANKQISCAYQALILNIEHPHVANGNKDIKIEMASTNLNAEKVPAAINIKISELTGPDRILKERIWTRPDQFVMSKVDFTKDFPYDMYDNENEISQFPIVKTSLTTTINTRNQNDWVIDGGKLKAGYYQIEATAKDSLGNQETYKNYLQVFDPLSKTIATGNIDLFNTNDQPMEPGEKDTIYTGTIAKDLFVIRHIQKETGSFQFINRKKGIEPFIYAASEKDRGGIFIEELFVFQNRIFLNRFSKRVPFTNKELQIKYQSFRDKTEPGSEEKWTVAISGKKGEKVAAELLTSMYDASLDEFKMQQWDQPNWWNEKYRSDFWKFNFGSETSIQNYLNSNSNESDISIDYAKIPASFNDLWEIVQPNIPFPIELDLSANYLRGKILGVNINSNSGSVLQEKTSLAAPLVARTYEDYDKVELSKKGQLKQEPVETIIRKDFNETAFFFPQLIADSSGSYQFSFTMPDAVTKWKWMSFAHTKDLSSGLQTTEIQTQKTLMVQSNAPRFMREGDKMEFSSRIANMSDKELTGQITLELIDATTNTSIDGWFQNIFPTQYFTVGPKQTEAVKFPIQIPFSYNKPLIWRVIAKSGTYSDGEENVLAVLSNRSLVTESLPILINGDTTLSFHFDKLLHQYSNSLSNESLTVEFSSNPIWYAVQALPYLKQGMDNCAEAIFHKIYANSIASFIVNKNPIIKTWFEQSKKDSASLLSNLQKNQPLKQVLLEETPWVLDANTEAERKKNLSELFDLIKLSESTDNSLQKLQELQLPNGSFSWFKGGSEDPFITTTILTGIGRLKKLGAITPDMAIRIKPMLIKALQFEDENNHAAYQQIIEHSLNLNQQHIGSVQIQYLYMRSFFADIAPLFIQANNYYLKQSRDFWNKFSMYDQSLIGLIQLRNNEERFIAKTILPSLEENAVTDKQKGMYWKQSNVWASQESQISIATSMIELLAEYSIQNKSAENFKKIDAIKTWLILNKQTNNWKTSIHTANACYAILLNGSNWLQDNKTVQIELGKTVFKSKNENTETGSGYFEKKLDASKIDSSLGNITITTKTVNTHNQKNNQPAWGAVHWQYFEDLDKITESASPLSVQKKLMIERLTDQGKELVAADLNNPLKVGDKVVVRIIIKTDREMDYVHLKDMRAAGMEPENILSGYKWQDGIGYYENTTDISSNFFISHLNKGTYIFEYPVYMTHIGNFSVGTASIQCMYAPEFNSHSEGVRINVTE